MKITHQLKRLALQEDLNFLLTNRIPRLAATRFVGWFSRIRHPWVYRLSMWVWTRFTDLDLSEARHTGFRSLHECFTRELRPGARPVDNTDTVIVSPSDGIVGATGTIEAVGPNRTQVFQIKGFPYLLEDLLGNTPQGTRWASALVGGCYVTLRLTSAMYHRFHAPDHARLSHVTYISGDTWNVNPIALRRIERLFCKNERAVLHLELADGRWLLLVPVAAILVASLRLHALDVPLNLRYPGPNELPCDAHYARGDEIGWFEHGSTIVVLAPPDLSLAPGMVSGRLLRMGEALLRKPAP
ncbi:MAG TPA: archaetidylserine decarboxylase [Hydrogenophaga sp.]|uniref:archaetidylserine decarboxylase n=1 Tax=Hydrogenophaga sp. TaxID=1904254 RepID=UPI002BE6DCFA|nr:archaetidylserine decarboxylase [Hydrogenophaga sp.]HMN93125.1 archaetidylserine decarboxylase [Hydrogenophaga sp.]HMP11770.1 archaetidylserine decarboxylase [Hydrogenophaga sp.]